MKIQRAIPPAAAPIDLASLLWGLAGFVSGTKYLKRLKTEIKEYFNVKHVFLVSSGKAALTITLNSLKAISPGGNEVIIPAYTCYSVPSAIMKAGLTVSLCDINPSTFDFDYDQLEKTINDKTLCVVPTHLFAIPVDMDRINKICSGKDLFILEDAAQAMGGVYKGKPLGTIGDVGFFSLGRGKNVTCGSGGIIVTNSDTIASVIESETRYLQKPGFIECLSDFLKVVVQNIFINPSAYWLPSGLPFLKLGETIFHRDFPLKGFSGIKAGLMKNWRKRLEESNRVRKKNAEHFRKLCDLNLGKDVSIPFLRMPLMVRDREARDTIYDFSSENGLGISKMYPAPVHEIDEIKEQFRGRLFPFAKAVAERLLTVPTHQLLSEKDKDRILRELSAVNPGPLRNISDLNVTDSKGKITRQIKAIDIIK